VSLLAELTRPYWLPGIHAVSGKPAKGVAAWVAAEDFQIYAPLDADEAVLSFAMPEAIVAAFAGDASRMAIAALESIEGIRSNNKLPKSMGWLFVRSYYSAFFAAHAVLRMFGRSATQLETPHTSSIHAVADAYGVRNGKSLTKGIYGFTVDVPARRVTMRKRAGGDGGSHATMWGMFVELLTSLSSDVLASGAARVPAQNVSNKLVELRDVLINSGFPGGNWLSHMRNRVNYQLAFGTWFPYAERQPYYDGLFESCDLWREDPMSVSVWSQRGRDLQRFIEATALITSICRALSVDMAGRHPTGKSFHRYGALALLSRFAQA
jgi:hypothetical protein